MAEDNIIRLTRKHARKAAYVLEKAFHDYPESVYFYPDEVKRNKRQPAIYHLVLKDTLAYSEVYATSLKIEGAAVWYFVDGEERPWRHGFSPGWFWQSLFTDKETDKRKELYFEYTRSVRARVAPKRYWYLMMIGVDPAQQGNGYAGRLIRPMLARADREGVPVFLETQVEKNIKLYEHFGFRVIHEGIIAGTDITSWAMQRDPVKAV